ncbi:hypothetical protein [Bifidobacterium eulemuris]|uniref:Uncharacterized protein n=1 Tax=Bifidobacterium eulemuris TaxID=1765219 RepID=A0A261G9S2_9BIFI|nr:hypothetical protein [Bifidobacterium eulemuris]OZG68158.1 hypothetical protein BEUL_1171 [Bifidobacterium eulemuris]QOL31780.1 hypothetical protein BE0216_04345 [Bifidobacterium eulemuris]
MEHQLNDQLEHIRTGDSSPPRCEGASDSAAADAGVDADDPLLDVEKMTRRVMHDYHLRGDCTFWDSLLCPQTVWLGSGASMMFGGDSIRNHFREFVHIAKADILIERNTIRCATAGSPRWCSATSSPV